MYALIGSWNHFFRKNEMEKIVQELSKVGIIHPSIRPCSSLVVMVLKKEIILETIVARAKHYEKSLIVVKKKIIKHKIEVFIEILLEMSHGNYMSIIQVK